ncbi:hypothetical protein BDV95DRAFT_574975 [Massariosphaeria phaeospora]|uniref:Uncharacterized protein n=1 Tax=Massariosphaeria phaeospora TaxID=100035 RepID=A0A7C8M4H2_9PLEO|nr:hypothetical protein BDV95DRAFT_574975 [Massariosphaeria phaeospora]
MFTRIATPPFRTIACILTVFHYCIPSLVFRWLDRCSIMGSVLDSTSREICRACRGGYLEPLGWPLVLLPSGFSTRKVDNRIGWIH